MDVIVIARGGGALEDLLPFSNEALLRAVAACRTPVVSAIGHEVDQPLLDLVADVRASTPTDAAKRVVPDVAAEAAGVTDARRRMLAAPAGPDRARAAAGWRRCGRARRWPTPAAGSPSRAHGWPSCGTRATATTRRRLRARRATTSRTCATASGRCPPRRRWSAATPWCRTRRATSSATPDQVSEGTKLQIRVAGGTLRATSDAPEQPPAPE